jgi:hypothetical protein
LKNEVFGHLGVLAESQITFTIQSIQLRSYTIDNLIFSKSLLLLVPIKNQYIIPGNISEHFYLNSIEKFIDACHFNFFKKTQGTLDTLTVDN